MIKHMKRITRFYKEKMGQSDWSSKSHNYSSNLMMVCLEIEILVNKFEYTFEIIWRDEVNQMMFYIGNGLKETQHSQEF